MAEKKDLPEIVAEILIEMQQMREDSKHHLIEQRKFNEDQRKFNEDQRELNVSFTSELHAQREVQERIVAQLEKLNERVDKSDKNSELMADRIITAVLNRIDRVKDEISELREDAKKRENLDERVRRIETTLYGKAS